MKKPGTPKVTQPTSLEGGELQIPLETGTYEKLCHAQDLLRGSIPSGDVSQVLDVALDALIRELEKQKLAATKRPPQRPARP